MLCQTETCLWIATFLPVSSLADDTKSAIYFCNLCQQVMSHLSCPMCRDVSSQIEQFSLTGQPLHHIGQWRVIVLRGTAFLGRKCTSYHKSISYVEIICFSHLLSVNRAPGLSRTLDTSFSHSLEWKSPVFTPPTSFRDSTSSLVCPPL